MTDTIHALRDELRQFMAERDWGQFHDPKNLAMLLASEVGELCDVYRWVPNADADSFSARPENREAIADEVADVAIGVLLLADRIGLDLAQTIRAKMIKNGQKYPVELSRGKADRPTLP
jgi:NTP pyrophosphatase (non-canonical NTP hydrolase)